MAEQSITGRRILVVEDEAFVADSLKLYLEEVGAVVLGPVASVGEAVDLVAVGGPLDAAVLDVNLRGAPAFPVADALAARGVPFVFTTGYAAESLPERFASVARCQKPFRLADLVALLAR